MSMSTATALANRHYQTRARTLEKLDLFLIDMQEAGEVLLPPERTLCQQLHCSRETLRRALESREASGVIVTRDRTRILASRPRDMSVSLGEFAFVAMGQRMIANPAWNKLWMELQPLAQAKRLSANLILIPYGATPEKISEFLTESPELLVVATLRDSLIENIIDAPDKTIITTEENYRGQIANIVAMDNHAAGHRAAQALSESGYHRPAFVCERLLVPDHLYIPYEKRLQGFRDGCGKTGLPFDEASEFWLSGSPIELFSQMSLVVEQIIAGGFDSIFLHTDCDLEVFYGALQQKAEIPADLGLVTVNSYDVAVRHTPLVSAVSHGTPEVANTLINCLCQMLTTGETNIGEIMVTPAFYEGGTL